METGKVRVTKAVIAVTCGRIVNPEGMRHQLQGGLIQGLSRSLMEEIKYDQGRITDSDWRSYPILRSATRSSMRPVHGYVRSRLPPSA
jgi:CO/xanthine dehydrogenase Mo-binding subunit